MMPGAHVVIFLTALILNWLYVDEGIGALAVDVMAYEVDEEMVDEVEGDEAGEEVKMTAIRPGSAETSMDGEVRSTCRSAC